MRKNVFIVAKPGFSAINARADESVLHSDFGHPKADITRRPDHVGIIDLNWVTTGIIIPFGEIRTLFYFPHGYTGIPTVIAPYALEQAGIKSAGMMGIQMNAIGLITMDADEKNVNLKYISFDLGGIGSITPFHLLARYYVFADRGFIKEREQ